ncbi:hypothetical protein ACSBR2_032107 [Camellia fascicularis]
MEVKKIEVKVNIHCHKCKSNILKSSLNFKISVASEKGILTIIGNVNPVLVTTQVRKTRKVADLIGVGPPKAKEKKPNPLSLNPLNVFGSTVLDSKVSSEHDEIQSHLAIVLRK